MTILPLAIGNNNPVLRTKTMRVKKITKEVMQGLEDMRETMDAARGVGLAAPQVGRNERICLATVGGKIETLINPDITWKSETTSIAEEGCLSLPGLWLNIKRPTDIIVHYESIHGKKYERKLGGFDARVVQHEVDHLEGILIVDHLESSIM